MPRAAFARARAFAESLVGVERRPGLFDDKHALEQPLQERLGTLFGLDYDLLLYDITSTYFEGAAAVRLRCVVRPDQAQTIQLHHLGLTLPQRLQLPHGLGVM